MAHKTNSQLAAENTALRAQLASEKKGRSEDYGRHETRERDLDVAALKAQGAGAALRDEVAKLERKVAHLDKEIRAANKTIARANASARAYKDVAHRLLPPGEEPSPEPENEIDFHNQTPTYPGMLSALG